MRRYAVPAAALLLVATLAGCSDEEPGNAQPSGSPAPSATPSPTESVRQSPTPSAPAAGEPTTALLDWQPTGESVDATVVVGREWRAVVPDDERHVVLSRGDESVRVPAGRGFRISQVLMDADTAVVVAQDEAEQRPAKGLVMDLASGDRGPVPGPVPATGGSWTMHGDELRYPTTARRRAYCLAAVHLPSGTSQVEHCAGKGEGFSRAVSSGSGTAMMVFDDARPVSCRTLVLLSEGPPVPVEGVPECKGWDVVATPTGAVWSTVPDEQNVQQGDFAATHDGEVVPLGPGATGTLVPCGDSVFFARNAAGGDPARLLRWVDGELQVAYESPGDGPGFLSTPACAGDVLTLTLLSADGDEQVWAPVGSEQ